MYVVYDENGSILQTIVGPDKTYGPDILDKANYRWIFLMGRDSLDPRTTYVDVITKTIAEKMPMALTADKFEIIADGSDKATISGIPEGASISVLCDGQPQFADVIGKDALFVTALSPATYLISATCKGYLPASLAVVAK